MFSLGCKIRLCENLEGIATGLLIRQRDYARFQLREGCYIGE